VGSRSGVPGATPRGSAVLTTQSNRWPGRDAGTGVPGAGRASGRVPVAYRRGEGTCGAVDRTDSHL